MNATTALAWSCYFFGLTHLEPAVVNTIHTGMGPLTVLSLAGLGSRLVRPSAVGALEYGCFAGIALSLAGLWWVVLSGRSGLGVESLATSAGGLALLSVSGASITVSLLYSKRLNEAGVGSDALTAVRYLLMIGLAAGLATCRDSAQPLASASELSVLTVAALALIVVPTFVMQAGIVRTAPLTAHVIRGLGPVCIFAVEQYDQRMTYSSPTLACILAYSAFAIASNVVHGWRHAGGGATAGDVGSGPAGPVR